MTPFRGEKNTNWEGGWRVPAMVRWPGKIKAGVWSTEIMHHMDWLSTFPYERAQLTSNTYYDWLLDRVYLLLPASD